MKITAKQQSEQSEAKQAERQILDESKAPIIQNTALEGSWSACLWSV